MDIRLALLNRLSTKFAHSLGVEASQQEALILSYEMVNTLLNEDVLKEDGTLKGEVDGVVLDHLPLVQLIRTLALEKKLPPVSQQHPKYLRTKN